MKYKERIEHIDFVAEEMMKNNTTETQIRVDLKNRGLYDADIDKVIFSAKNVIGDKLKPTIRAKLLSGESIRHTTEFEKLDQDLLERLIKQETKSISLGEKKNVNDLLINGMSTEDILKEVRLDFYPKEIVVLQVATFNKVKDRNTVSSRMPYILGGIGLMIVGAGISYATMQGGGRGRLFYGLIVVGFIIMTKGFITVKNPF